MLIKLNVGSEFDEDSARKAKADAQRYYQRQSAELKVKAALDDSTTRAAAQDAERKFVAAGRDAGTGFARETERPNSPVPEGMPVGHSRPV